MAGRRTGLKVVILECRGTHNTKTFAVEQLARASVQVEALRVGGRTPPSLMVASCLSRTRITSYVLDPPGDADLLSGPNRELDELLRGDPADQSWRPHPAPTREPTIDVTCQAGRQPNSSAGQCSCHPGQPTENLQPGALDIFEVPEERRSWFAQVVTRAIAATALLFAGNNSSAREYATPR